jgi:putative ABC transport system permease protein
MNDLIAAWRNLLRNRFYSSVNIFGLTIGLTACLLVTTVIIDELSYDKQWSKADRIYRILSVNKVGNGIYNQNAYSFAAVAPALKRNFAEVEEYSDFNYLELQLQLGKDKNEGVRTDVLTADTAIFHMLDIHVVEGNPKIYKSGYPNLILTKSFANKFFRGQNVVGKTIYDKATYQEKPTAYLITGVIEDIPTNSHLRADVLVVSGGRSKEVLHAQQGGSMMPNYLLMRPGTDMRKFTKQVNKFYKSIVTGPRSLDHAFQPIKKVYLDSPFAVNQHVRGDRQQIIIFSAVAALLLIIACINFINLTTARAASKMGDTSVRRLLGAERKHIVKKVFIETLLFFGSAALLALALYALSLSPVESFLGHSLGKTLFSDPILSAFVLGALIVAAVVSGSYPAILISSFRPAGVLKGSLMSNRNTKRSFLRQGLVVVQFSLCICVLIAMIVVHQQLKYMEQADLGFNKNNLINIGFISWDGKADVFKNELNRIPGVVSSSRCFWTPSKGPGYMMTEIDDPLHPGSKTTVWHLTGDVNFAQTLGLRLKEGRYLSSSYGGDMSSESTGNCLITATTARLLNIDKLNVNVKMIGVTPVGIIEDFHNESFHEAFGPTVVGADTTSTYGNMIVRVKPGSASTVQAGIHKVWARLFPDKLLELDLVTDMLDRQYEREQKMRQLFSFFGVLTMLLASLGIFGLIVHSIQERVKEIAIRKVLGGSVVSIAWLLSSRFSKLVAVAIILASPFGMWSMTKWLESFAFRVELDWTVPIIAGAGALSIALVTVSWQAIKASLANPVESLRSE